MDFADNPNLIDNNTKYFMYETLKTCHTKRAKLYNIIWNVSIVVCFLVITAITLYLCATRKKQELKDKNKDNKMLKDQYYILEKIKEFKEMEKYQKQTTNTFTQLPITS